MRAVQVLFDEELLHRLSENLEVKRGEIWLYRFGKPDKRRPVLVVSRDDVIGLLHAVCNSIGIALGCEVPHRPSSTD